MNKKKGVGVILSVIGIIIMFITSSIEREFLSFEQFLWISSGLILGIGLSLLFSFSLFQKKEGNS